MLTPLTFVLYHIFIRWYTCSEKGDKNDHDILQIRPIIDNQRLESTFRKE